MVMTVALTCSSWLSKMLRSTCVKAKQIQSMFPVAHACILCLAPLTPFSLFPSTSLFHLCRILQTALMGQYVLLSPHGNNKLKALLQGTFLHRIFFFASVDDFVNLASGFFDEKAVYLRFSHIPNFQPSLTLALLTSSSVLDRERTRFRKFLQVPVQQNKFVLAEVALRFWNKHDNFWMWSIFPLHAGQSNFWALEQALIQLWQPRLNTPFSYQFFQFPKGTDCTAPVFNLS